ncbi:unnamed protein product, partial [Brugia timori]|uniref:Integrase catalytic domain-containing protein n=1 Tax=Brugia timori TaxID=42155 RepID=A0A0R3QHM5_9BILA
MGPILPMSYKGYYSYIVVFIDDYSRYARAYPMADKTKVHICLQLYLEEVRRVLGQDAKIIKIRTDNGTEYQTYEMKKLMVNEKIIFQHSEPGTPEHNGTSERFNDTLQQKIRSLIFDAGLPKQFWNYALGFAVHAYNRTPHKSIDFKTPYEIMFSRKPNIQYLRRFGCLVYAKNLKKGGKFDERGRKGILVGCTETGYRILILLTGDIIDCKHVRCIESKVFKDVFDNQTSLKIKDPDFDDAAPGAEFLKIYGWHDNNLHEQNNTVQTDKNKELNKGEEENGREQFYRDIDILNSENNEISDSTPNVDVNKETEIEEDFILDSYEVEEVEIDSDDEENSLFV